MFQRRTTIFSSIFLACNICSLAASSDSAILFEKANKFRTAILKSDTNTIRSMHANGYNINQVFPFDDFQRLQLCPLSWAVRKGKYDVVKTMIDLGSDMSQKDRDGFGPAMWAVSSNELEILKLLIKEGSKLPERYGPYNRTPLFLASSMVSLDIVLWLLENGADPNIQDDWGQAPIYVASKTQQSRIVQALLKAGANPNIKRQGGLTPLMVSIGFILGSTSTAQSLVEAGADVNLSDDNGWTPLMYAAAKDDSTLCKWLIENGAKIDLKNKENLSALGIAGKYKKERSITVLSRCKNK